MKRIALLSVLIFAGVAAVKAQTLEKSCEALSQITLPGAKVTSALSVAAGAFTLPSADTGQAAEAAAFYKTLPAFCRVTVEAKPSDDSDIRIEVWMPASGWNGRFRGQGNGGFAGEINYRGLGVAISQGYASASTDTGHAGQATDASWALGHPEKVTDFGYRAIHEMTEIAKTLVKAFYGNAPQHSYFGACSNGGRQALMEVQRFPEDYDGVLAGAPANFWTHLLTSALWDAQATTLDPASYIPTSKVPAIARAVNAACDAQDSVADGVLNDPRQCKFDPEKMLCKQGDSDSCLTAPQAAALKKLYQGSHDSHGHPIFPGFVPGAEDGRAGWGLWITGSAPGKALLFAFGNGFFANMVYERADWDYKKANLDDAVKAADEKMSQVLNATETNLKAFQSRGGKLIIYHGWNDPAISALYSINYYDSVVKTMGPQEASSFLRLFLAPGMQHCADGPGPDSFGQFGTSPQNDAQHSAQIALEEWVEKGTAPSKIIASKRAGDSPTAEAKTTRPLCAYPLVAKYKGSGDVNDAANFTCAPGNP